MRHLHLTNPIHKIIATRWIAESGNGWHIFRQNGSDVGDVGDATVFTLVERRPVLISTSAGSYHWAAEPAYFTVTITAFTIATCRELWCAIQDWFWTRYIIASSGKTTDYDAKFRGPDIREFRQFTRPDEHRYMAAIRGFIADHQCRYAARGDDRRIGVLLIGPPGVGKTTTAGAFAAILHKPLYVVATGRSEPYFAGRGVINCIEDVDRLMKIAEKRGHRQDTLESLLRTLDEVDAIQRGERGDAVIITSTDRAFANTIKRNVALNRRYTIVHISRPDPNLAPVLTFEDPAYRYLNTSERESSDLCTDESPAFRPHQATPASRRSPQAHGRYANVSVPSGGTLSASRPSFFDGPARGYASLLGKFQKKP